MTRHHPQTRPRISRITAPQRQSGALPPHRRRRVLRTARRPGHRRRQSLQQQTQGMGGLLQLPSPPRRPQRPNTLRTTTPGNPDPAVTDDRQSHTAGGTASFSRPIHLLSVSSESLNNPSTICTPAKPAKNGCWGTKPAKDKVESVALNQPPPWWESSDLAPGGGGPIQPTRFRRSPWF